MKHEVVSSIRLVEDLRALGYQLPMGLSRLEVAAVDNNPAKMYAVVEVMHREHANERIEHGGALTKLAACPCCGATLVPGAKLAAAGQHDDWVRAAALSALEVAHARRHELRGYSSHPESGMTDYAPAAQWITAAMTQLDEALPLGQVERTRRSLEALLLGVAKLTEWVETKLQEVSV